jgi:hypothetical protein
MKNHFKLCLFGILIFTAASCNKDEDPVINGSIVGQWRMTDIHSNDGVLETTIGGQTVNGTYSFHGTDYNTVTTFTENPNEFSSTGSYTSLTDFVIAGQIEHDTSVVDAFAGTGTWSINGNKLTQIFSGDTSTFDILELSDSKLRLQIKIDETVADSIFEIYIHDRATVFSTFEKQ